MSDFDPYREWLDMDASHTPTYYQLLNVSPSETDRELIRKQALRQLRKLSQVDSGGRKELKDKLTKRVQRAAKCLLSDSLRREYDRKLAATDGPTNRPTLETAMGGDPGVVTPDVEIVDVASSDNPVAHFDLSADVPSEIAVPPPADAIEKTPPPQMIGRKYRQRNRKTQTLLWVGAMGMVSSTGILFLLATQSSWGQKLLQQAGVQKPVTKRPFDADAEPLPMEEPLARPTSLPQGNPENLRDRDVEPDSRPSNLPPPAMARERRPMANVQPPTPVQIKELAVTLTEIRQALQARDLVRADKLLQQIEELPKRPQDAAKYQRLELLTYYVKEYWKGIDESLARLQGGTEVVMGAQRMIVVEINDKELVVRYNGQNRRIARDNLPPALESAMANRAFNQNAASTKVFLGAKLAVSPDPSTAAVRKLWEQAKREGASLGDLEAVLDDTYDLPAD